MWAKLQVCPRTSYQDACEQLFLKPLYEDRKPHHPFYSLQSGTNLKTMCPSASLSSPIACKCVLPKHPPDYNKRYLETTHLVDFQPPYPYESKTKQFIPDNSAAFKKCISQFTDQDNHRRSGQNTWHDESGLYGNRIIKAQLYEPTLPEMRPEQCTHIENHGKYCGKKIIHANKEMTEKVI